MKRKGRLGRVCQLQSDGASTFRHDLREAQPAEGCCMPWQIYVLDVGGDVVRKQLAADQGIVVGGHGHRLLGLDIQVEDAPLDGHCRGGVHQRQPFEIVDQLERGEFLAGQGAFEGGEYFRLVLVE